MGAISSAKSFIISLASSAEGALFLNTKFSNACPPIRVEAHVVNIPVSPAGIAIAHALSSASSLVYGLFVFGLMVVGNIKDSRAVS